jgi:hypothetical protein
METFCLPNTSLEWMVKLGVPTPPCPFWHSQKLAAALWYVAFALSSRRNSLSSSKPAARREPHYVVEVDANRRVEFARARDGVRSSSPKERVETASWQQVSLSKPAGNSECYAANLGKAALGGIET